MIRPNLCLLGLLAVAASVYGQKNGAGQLPDTIMIDEVSVSAHRQPIKSQFSVENREVIGRGELVRAACCNLGESFTSNPSVDVSYTDAATGAAQIKLLGLSGIYVQMMQENVPAFRQAAIPYALGYVPGPWMQSIQVSKGASSVKNGYESVTGQINIEYVKPQGVEAAHGNLYYDADGKVEANADGAIHLTDHLSTALLLHYEDLQGSHDKNHDGFLDMPNHRALNIMDRWAWVSPHVISQLSVRYLDESLKSGTSSHHDKQAGISDYGRYHIAIDTRRIEGQWKNALLLRQDKGESLALIVKGVWHDMDNSFGYGRVLHPISKVPTAVGNRLFLNQKNAYAQLLYEVDMTPSHNLSVGASFNHDYLRQTHKVPVPLGGMYDDFGFSFARSTETTSGAYAQYTFKHDDLLSLMLGLRYDHSSLHGGFFTPRLHLKYHPAQWLTWRASAGKGYRTSHPLVENVSFLASSRKLPSLSTFFQLKQEEAWNMGTSLSFDLPVGEESLQLNLDYYYTHFLQQTIIDLDHPNQLFCYSLPDGGRSFSHVFQIDATYPLFSGLSLTLAYRYQDVRATQYDECSFLPSGLQPGPIDGIYVGTTTSLRTRPLTSRYKALATASWKSPLEFWQVDVTYQLNGPGRMPALSAQQHDQLDASQYTHFDTATPHYKAYGLLQAQVTREFRFGSVYLGGENLLGFTQKHPILSADAPYSQSFDAASLWAPAYGRMVYAGVRLNLEWDR